MEGELARVITETTSADVFYSGIVYRSKLIIVSIIPNLYLH